MGSQDGHAGDYLDRLQDKLCACGSWHCDRGQHCNRCEVERAARSAAQQARKTDQEHRERVEAFRRQQAEHSRSTKTYRPICAGCGETFHTRSKKRRLCSGCSASSLGFAEKMTQALQRGIGFSLTLQQWEALRGQPCHYCGDTFNGVRLDRVDSDGEYAAANVVSCCTPCNMMKNTMPIDVFRDRIARMAAHMGAAHTGDHR